MSKNGRGAIIVDFVRSHPGCSARDIRNALGGHPNNGLLTYLRSVGQVVSVGRRGTQRYFATQAEADAAQARVLLEAEIHRAEIRRQQWRRYEVRRKRLRALRRELLRLQNSGATVAPDLRVTIARRPPDRYAVDPAFVGEFSREWAQRRQE